MAYVAAYLLTLARERCARHLVILKRNFEKKCRKNRFLDQKTCKTMQKIAPKKHLLLLKVKKKTSKNLIDFLKIRSNRLRFLETTSLQCT